MTLCKTSTNHRTTWVLLSAVSSRAHSIGFYGVEVWGLRLLGKELDSVSIPEKLQRFWVWLMNGFCFLQWRLKLHLRMQHCIIFTDIDFLNAARWSTAQHIRLFVQRGLIPRLGLLLRSSHVLPMSAGVFSRVLWLPPTFRQIHSRLIEHSVLSLGVIVSANGCLFMCALLWEAVQGAPCLLPEDTWHTLQDACDPRGDKLVRKMDGWMYCILIYVDHNVPT